MRLHAFPGAFSSWKRSDMSAAVSVIGNSVLGAVPIALIEGPRYVLLVRVGRVLEGYKRVER